MRHVGIVLAGGASTRMGKPKALLPTADGRPLGLHQATLLEQAGCADVVVVLGADHETVCPALGACRTVRNADWDQGRVSSVQTGLRAVPDADGYFILPVDTVGIKLETLVRMRACAEGHRSRVVRAVYRGEAGFVVWISSEQAGTLTGVDVTPETRLDLLLDAATDCIDVDDPAILNNVNTPEDWERVRGE